MRHHSINVAFFEPGAARMWHWTNRFVNDRRAAQMRHPVLGDGVEDGAGLDPPQADMGARQRRHRPGKHQPLQWNIGKVQR